MTNQIAQTQNIFANPNKSEHIVAPAGSDQERAIQEVQASLVIAKKFPRDTQKAVDNIIKECMRPTLAESAEYAFPRGGQTVTGPSIRLAESIARCWGNMDYGMRELEQGDGESQVEAYAWDVETNTRARRVFTVKHVRHTRQGQYELKDPRDIYELTANQGARRMRACILELIPGDVVDTALNQVGITLQSTAEVTPEAIQKMIEVFSSFGVTEEMISNKYNKKLIALLPAEFVDLKRIYAGLRDGMSKPNDWFDTGFVDQTEKQEEVINADSAIEGK